MKICVFYDCSYCTIHISAALGNHNFYQKSNKNSDDLVECIAQSLLSLHETIPVLLRFAAKFNQSIIFLNKKGNYYVDCFKRKSVWHRSICPPHGSVCRSVMSVRSNPYGLFVPKMPVEFLAGSVAERRMTVASIARSLCRRSAARSVAFRRRAPHEHSPSSRPPTVVRVHRSNHHQSYWRGPLLGARFSP